MIVRRFIMGQMLTHSQIKTLLILLQTKKGCASFFSSSEDLASSYGEQVYSIRLKLEKPLVIDAKGKGWSSLQDADIVSDLSPEYLEFKDKQLKGDADLLERIGNLLGESIDSTVSVDEGYAKKVGDLSGSRKRY